MTKEEIDSGEGMRLPALRSLESVDPRLFLSPNADLSRSARLASQYLFKALLPHFPECPVDCLLVDGLDAEQVYYQIALQSQPLISRLCRKFKRYEKNPPNFNQLFDFSTAVDQKEDDVVKKDDEREDDVVKEDDEREDDVVKEDDEREDDVEDEGFSTDACEGSSEEDLEDGDEKEVEEEDEKELRGVECGNSIEDRFLKMEELEDYLEKEDEREHDRYKDNKRGGKMEDVDDSEEEEDDEVYYFKEQNEENGDMKDIRYDDFFGNGSKRKNNTRKKMKSNGDSEEEGEEDLNALCEGELSTHEKKLLKARSKIELMERENLGPKSWTMLGEITASKRPKNSALEVDLDFEHNVRPAPVITEEYNASIEDLIKKRIVEGRFDDVQRAPPLQTKQSKIHPELDENKSKKGLVELYEEEYTQKEVPFSAPSSSDEAFDKELSRLCHDLFLDLDALSHFQFAPRPDIEEMSVNVNVPALAIEEVAPVAVSDAAMLAPEEIFSGKGDIKEDIELTQAEKKRRRANKKRKFKAKNAERMEAKKARENAVLTSKRRDGDSE